MDALDMRLLRAMGTEPFEHGARPPDALKPARLAEAIGTTRQTVETRLARMENSGIISGYFLAPNLRQLDLEWGIYHWKVPDETRKSATLERLEPIDGLEAVYTFLGPDVCTVHYWRNESERLAMLERVREVSGSTHPMQMYARITPPQQRALTHLDWRIIRALRPNARRPLDEIASEIGVSTRTVKRHVERMAREHSFDVAVRVALEKAPRSIPLAFLFHYAPEGGKATTRALLSAFDDRCLSAWIPPSPEMGNCDMSILAESVGEIEELRARALALPGVARVEVLLYTGGRVNAQWMDAAIERKVQETAPA